MDENKSGLYIVGIVAIIAVVALVVLILGASSKSVPVQSTTGLDNVGYAAQLDCTDKGTCSGAGDCCDNACTQVCRRGKGGLCCVGNTLASLTQN